MALEPLARWLRSVRSEAGCARDNRVLIAGLYCSGMLGLGLCIAALGPALLSLAVQTNATLTATGYAFTGRSIGYLLGSFLGPVFDRVPGHVALAATMALAGIGSFVIPVVPTVAALGVAVSLQGIGMGGLDTGSNVMLIYLYKADVGPWMQSMHASFAIGAFLAPTLLRMTERPNPHHRGDSGGGGTGVTSGSYDIAFYIIGAYCVAVGAALLATQSPQPRKGELHHGGGETAAVATSSAGGAAAPAAGGVAHSGESRLVTTDGNAENGLALETLDGAPAPVAAGAAPPGGAGGHTWHGEVVPVVPDTPAPAATHGGSKGDAAPSATASFAPSAGFKRQRWVVILVTALLLLQYVGCEAGYGAFATAFGVAQLGMSEARGQLLAAVYWAFIMVGRLLAIPLSLFFPPARYLGANMVGCCVGAIILLAGQHSEVAVWLGTVVYGLCMAPVFPTAIALTETYVPVHGVDATVLVVGSALGEWVLPFIIASLFGDVPGDTEIQSRGGGPVVGPGIVVWLVAVVCVTNAATFLLLLREGRRLKALTVRPAAGSAPAGAAGSERVA